MSFQVDNPSQEKKMQFINIETLKVYGIDSMWPILF